MDTEKVKGLLEQLKVTRARLNHVQEQYTKQSAKLLEPLKDMLGHRDTLREEVEEISVELRTLALEEYFKTQQKTLPFGLGIRVQQQLVYTEEAALSWAYEHKLALKLDKTAFEKIAKAQQLDIVTYREVPTATIPQEIEVDEEKDEVGRC